MGFQSGPRCSDCRAGALSPVSLGALCHARCCLGLPGLSVCFPILAYKIAAVARRAALCLTVCQYLAHTPTHPHPQSLWALAASRSSCPYFMEQEAEAQSSCLTGSAHPATRTPGFELALASECTLSSVTLVFPCLAAEPLCLGTAVGIGRGILF